MERAKENARGQGGRKGSHLEEGGADGTLGNNHAAAPRRVTPLFDVESLIRAGLTLIPLHRWDAKDAKGRARGKSPRDSSWQSREYDNSEVLAQAKSAGLNVGVRLPSTWMVLDIDPRNFPEGKDSLAELVADAGLDLSLCPHVITGSGGHHYYFRKPEGVSLLDSLDDYPGVEFKSLGRQVVAPGSVHPCGVRYEWDDLAPFPEEAPQLPEKLLQLIRRPTKVYGEAAGLGELTPEMLAESLEWLDPTDFSEHETWLTLMMACHHATAGEGRQEFIDWSTQDPDYRDDAWIIGRRWDSLHVSPTGGRRGRPVTIKYLHKVVQEAGGEVARVAPEEDFDVWEDAAELGHGVDDALLRAEPKAAVGSAEAAVEELNAKHYVVVDNGFQILTEEADPIFDGRIRYQRMSKSDFRSFYENRTVEVNNKLVSKADVWLKSPHRRTYKGVIFDPAGNHEGWLNMWKGWAYEPKEGDWSLLRQLIFEVLVDGDATSFEYVLDWIAFMFQHPEKVAEVAIAFRGEKGTGKGTLGRTLYEITGASVMTQLNLRHA